jgi:6-phospho-beta-glucosidase
VVVNTRNHGAIEDIEPGEVVEVPCWIDADGPEPIRMGALPQAGRGLVLAMKAYERLVIRAAVRGSLELAKLALMVCPFTETAPVSDILEAAVERDPLQLGYLRPASFATAGD